MGLRFPDPPERKKRGRKANQEGSSVAPAPRRLALLIGNGRVRNPHDGGYALNIPGIDKDLAALGGVLGDSECAGFEVRRHREVGLPFDVLARQDATLTGRFLRAVDRVSVYARPTLFAYQFVLHLERPRAPELVSSHSPGPPAR